MPLLRSEVHLLEIGGNECLSPELVARVNEACDYIEASPNSAVLIHTKGTSPPSGDQWWPGSAHQVDIHLVSQWEQALRRIERLPVATLSVTEGMCRPVALEVLLSTDYRLVSYDLCIQLKGPAGQVWPSLGLYRLVNQVGAGWSRQFALFGSNLSATQAAELGIVDEVTDHVSARAINFVETLAEGTCANIAVRRRLLQEATGSTFENAFGAHLAACDRVMRQMRVQDKEVK